MMTFSDFVHKYNSKNEATSNIKIQQVLSFLGLDDVDMYLRDGPFSSDIGIVNLRPFRGSHRIFYINENFFDSCCCPPPEKLSKLNIKRNGYCLYSEYRIPGLTTKKDSYCASYCLHIIYLTKLLGIDFKSAVLNLYYQRFSY